MKKTNKEYAASHSVDTDWFAIDKDGNLGYMNALEDAPLPVSISHEHYEDPDYELHCMLELCDYVEPNFYRFPITENSLIQLDSYLKEEGRDLSKEDSELDEYGEWVLTNGNGIKATHLWQNRTEESYFFVAPGDCIALIMGKTIGLLDDIKEGKIVAIDWTYFPEIGIPFECLSFDTIYEKKYGNRIQLELTGSSSKKYKSIIKLNTSFKDNNSITLNELAYHHFPDQCDSHPIDELRERINKMTEKERIAFLFRSIRITSEERKNLYGSNMGERAVGLLLNEYNISPDVKNCIGQTPIQVAKTINAGDGYDAQASLSAIIKMLELKEKELCQK